MSVGLRGAVPTSSDTSDIPAVSEVLSELDDNSLVARMVQGDKRAYRVVVERYYRGIVGIARRMGLTGGDAEDVAQDVFVRVWLHREKWRADGGATFKTWLYRVAVNRVIDIKRKPQFVDGAELDEVPDEAMSAVDRLAQHQEFKRLRLAIKKLSDQQQIAINLFYDRELSNQEAASIMGVSVNAMESLLKRARKRLREELKTI
ncbi:MULTISPECIES: sigma-70 family RNA polymerase sigma factor [Thalassospira]|uniref:sigma-70 family RNA polymerase sigma factor n=1 Tax=Thalassospira TaxID=168934 RepID=UPI001478188A|nr:MULTISPECIES: sigma-70 family RNA polymerase sigma factor [Thalassospira]MBO6770709.1 sigma-70 family RNA polymerase sigma factor [Thalassospira sp.]MEE3045221.1 sigma-70 family RNA polymerase sigma factor [Pseudomonadota bacterium]URK16385.1 sigma-70 family RNA polymerase sigma factor [Thalassospira sp. GO-4]